MKLTFGKGNAKLDKRITTFAIPSGYTCPGAAGCLTWANRKTGKIRDGKNQIFRCFSASQEAAFPNVRKSRWKNFQLLQSALATGGVEATAQLISRSLPKNVEILRIHVAGDFFSANYLDAWILTAQQHPHITMYAYTKSLSFLTGKTLPANLLITASEEGRWDHLIEKLNLHSSKVVFHPQDANSLVIDHDDSNAYKPSRPKQFALLLHGTQPKGSVSGRALQTLRKEKIQFSYSSSKLESENKSKSKS